MTGQSGSSNPSKASPSKLNWNWLSARVPSSSTDSLGSWLDQQLDELEEQFSDFTTAKSLAASHRSSQANSDR
ncbi:MAG TPA: hypothetical protein DDW52_08920 [Planctomycetaceae bacterium]|nr:hypothetical protein [Planctomycetaceae bacterium]